MDGLTDNQLRVLRYLRRFHREHGYYATVRDVQKFMKWRSISTAHDLLTALEKKGRVEKKRITRNTVVWTTVE